MKGEDEKEEKNKEIHKERWKEEKNKEIHKERSKEKMKRREKQRNRPT